MPDYWKTPSDARLTALGEAGLEPDDVSRHGGQSSPGIADDTASVAGTKRAPTQRSRPTRLDKTALAVPEPRRLRDKAHVKFVSRQACLICGRQPADAHHVRFAQHPALGRKVSDEFTVPLCRVHHREVHRSRDEAQWWKTFRIDPLTTASMLWAQTRPLRATPERLTVDGGSADTDMNDVTAQNASDGAPDDQWPRSKLQNEPNAAGRFMTSLRQLEANRRNALKSTGPTSAEGKQRSRCNAVRHGLTAETVIGALEDAEDYKAFEAAVTADYDAQSAVERELVLRLASLLWRLRRATAMETGLLQIQAENLCEFRRARQMPSHSLEVLHAMFGPAEAGPFERRFDITRTDQRLMHTPAPELQ